jgi:hypothetical protein
VETAVKLVMPLLQPMDDNSNLHKLAQLQQLAKFNGTEKDELAAHARFNEQMGKTYMANIKVDYFATYPRQLVFLYLI